METATKRCPFCKEEIQADAVKCRYCGEFLPLPREEYKLQDEYKPQNECRPADTKLDTRQETNKPLPPKNYLVWAILTTVLCCPPFGIPSIVYAAHVNSQYAAGNYAEAERSSKKAKKWFLAGVITGGAVMLLYYLFIIVFGILDATTYYGDPYW